MTSLNEPDEIKNVMHGWLINHGY